MKSMLVLALFAAAACAAPAGPDAAAETLQYQNDNIGVGPFQNSFQTSNGISAQAEGQLVNEGTPEEALATRGSYSYVGDDGRTYTVQWVADQNGFQPQGAHLPVA